MPRFDRLDLSKEEGEEVAVSTPVEEIEAQDAHDEIVAVAADVAADVAQTEEAGEVVDEVKEEVAEQEAVIENNPTAVDATAATVATENFKRAYDMFGFESKGVSHESIVKDPIEALKLAHEDAKEFIASVIEKLKALFKVILTKIKGIYVKIVVALNGTKAQAEKLVKYLKEQQGKVSASATLDAEKVVKPLAGKLGAYSAATGTPEKFSTKLFTDILNQTTKTEEVAALSKAGKAVHDVILTESKKAGTGAGAFSKMDADTFFSAVEKALGAEFAAGKEAITKGVFKADAINSEGKTVIGAFIVGAGVGGLKVLVAYKPSTIADKLDAKAFVDLLGKVSFATVTVPMSTDGVGKVAEALGNTVQFTDLISATEEAVTAAGGVKAFAGVIQKSIEDSEKLLDEVMKESTVATAGLFIPVTRYTNQYVANVCMAKTLGYIGGVKVVLSTVKTLAKEFGAAGEPASGEGK